MTHTPDSYGDHSTRGNLRLGPGTVLGVYRLDEPLGRGGMGLVWKAWDTAGKRFVAVKLLPPEFTGNEAAIGQVRDAFQVVHALTHQHIGKTIGLLDDPQFGPYIVMEYLPGIPLSQFAKKYRRADGWPWSASSPTGVAEPQEVGSVTMFAEQASCRCATPVAIGIATGATHAPRGACVSGGAPLRVAAQRG